MPISRSIADLAARDPERLANTDTEHRLSYGALHDACARAGSVFEREFATQAAAGTAVAPPPESDGVPVVAVDIPAALVVRHDDESFLLLFTSGTTNKPKGFVKSRANWRACFPVSVQHYGAADGLVSYVPGSLAYSLTLYGLVEAIGTGGSCIVAAGFEPIDAVRGPDGAVLPEGEHGTLYLRAEVTCVPGYIASTTSVQLRDETGWATVGGTRPGASGTVSGKIRRGEVIELLRTDPESFTRL